MYQVDIFYLQRLHLYKRTNNMRRACLRVYMCVRACVYYIVLKSGRFDRGLISSLCFPYIIMNLESVLE